MTFSTKKGSSLIMAPALAPKAWNQKLWQIDVLMLMSSMGEPTYNKTYALATLLLKGFSARKLLTTRYWLLYGSTIPLVNSGCHDS